MIKVGIVGASGYAGAELVRLLLTHPEAEIVYFASRTEGGKKYAETYPAFAELSDAVFDDENLDAMADACDVIFTATPQGYLAGVMSEELLSKAKFIDLSADFRIKDAKRYEEWYGIHHETPQFLPEAVYGLPELFRAEIKGARLIANPGCYTTASILLLYPLLQAGLLETKGIIIDAKSGVSGAGRSAKVDNLFCEVNENMKAYGVGVHRHTPEIEDQLARAAGEEIILQFTPHLVPMMRGILATAYVGVKDGVTQTDMRAAYEKAYKAEHFVRLLPAGKYAETRHVKGSNFTDISFLLDERTGRWVGVSALDNLVKGAAGQAVQNMNLLFDLPEETGLMQTPLAI